VHKNPLVRPFLKWAGGKRQLLPEILSHKPKRYGTYYEPFLGGGAVLFDLQPKSAIVNDTNAELINCYEVVRDSVEALIDELAYHKAHTSQEHYYSVRDWDRSPEFCQRPEVSRAARIIYLNKTCYNGLFRVNSQGHFNVPYGKHANPSIFDVGVLRAVSAYLNAAQVTFCNQDFAEATRDATRGDFLYFDPPYDPVSDTASFTGYDVNGFGRDEQTRLKHHIDELVERGCIVVLNNACTPFIMELYSDWSYEVVGATRAINSDALRRGKVEEVLVAIDGRIKKRSRVGKTIRSLPDPQRGATLWTLPDQLVANQ
jgi:DNA adenine methylase